MITFPLHSHTGLMPVSDAMQMSDKMCLTDVKCKMYSCTINVDQVTYVPHVYKDVQSVLLLDPLNDKHSSTLVHFYYFQQYSFALEIKVCSECTTFHNIIRFLLPLSLLIYQIMNPALRRFTEV